MLGGEGTECRAACWFSLAQPTRAWHERATTLGACTPEELLTNMPMLANSLCASVVDNRQGRTDHQCRTVTGVFMPGLRIELQPHDVAGIGHMGTRRR